MNKYQKALLNVYNIRSEGYCIMTVTGTEGNGCRVLGGKIYESSPVASFVLNKQEFKDLIRDLCLEYKYIFGEEL